MTMGRREVGGVSIPRIRVWGHHRKREVERGEYTMEWVSHKNMATRADQLELRPAQMKQQIIAQDYW